MRPIAARRSCAAKSFEAAHLRQILKRDHHAGGFAGLSRQRRDAVAETKTHAFRRQTVRFKSRAPVAVFQCAQSLGDVSFSSLKRIDASLPRIVSSSIAGDLFCRDVEGEDTSVQIGGDQAGTNRRHDAFVQRAQVGQRLRCRHQTHIGRLSFGKSRGKQADDQNATSNSPTH